MLTFKRRSEVALQGSGLPYTILRPGRLTDGPYTSYDLNTLLQATAGSRQDVQLAPTDSLSGEASRIAVAGACVHCWVRRRRRVLGAGCRGRRLAGGSPVRLQAPCVLRRLAQPGCVHGGGE